MTNKPIALITGASEGLGKYLALECARRGLHLALVALPGSPLQEVAHYIAQQYGVQVWTFEKDLCAEESCRELYAAVKAQGLTISVLINNAGMGGTFLFQQRSLDFYNHLIRLNVMVPTHLTQLFLDDLKSHTPAFILNVSSMAALIPLPKKSVYGGSKAYVIGFSKSLRSELRLDGISVSVLCPGAMNTSWRLTMQNRTMGTWLSRQSVLDPCDAARVAVARLLQGKEVIVPGWWNRCFLLWNWLFPKRLKNLLTDYAIRTMPAAAETYVPLEPSMQPAAVA